MGALALAAAQTALEKMQNRHHPLRQRKEMLAARRLLSLRSTVAAASVRLHSSPVALGPPQRLAKVIAHRGGPSRRKAEVLISGGLVRVNGEVVTNLGEKVEDECEITVDGEELTGGEEMKLFVHNKKRGVLVTHSVDPAGRPTLFPHLEKMGMSPNLHSVGRLDYNTEGLLLLTNSPEVKEALEEPGVLERMYRVRVHGRIIPRRLASLRKGVTIKGFKFAPMDVRVEDPRLAAIMEAITGPKLGEDSLGADREREREQAKITRSGRWDIDSEPKGAATARKVAQDAIKAAGRISVGADPTHVEGAIPQKGGVKVKMSSAGGKKSKADKSLKMRGDPVVETLKKTDATPPGNYWLTFRLGEGKNRQIRIVLAHLGLVVNRIKRVKFGPWGLRGVGPGDVKSVPLMGWEERIKRIRAAKNRRKLKSLHGAKEAE